jgi:hypothetical protein
MPDQVYNLQPCSTLRKMFMMLQCYIPSAFMPLWGLGAQLGIGGRE